MASMNINMEEEQPKEEKPINRSCQQPSKNVCTNGANLAKSEEGLDRETTNLHTSHRHRKLPAELNQQIFYCFNLETRHKFIWGLGWGFYGMFRQILLTKSKRLRNPVANGWRSNAGITISNGGLNASNNTNGYQKVYAEKGFHVSVADCRMDDFPGTICYYYEVKLFKSALWCHFGFTFTDREILPGGWIGRSPNFYGIGMPIPNENIYQFYLSGGQRHRFEFPEGVIRPELKGTGNVAGCGILLDPDDKLTIFFTVNGILIGRQFPIDPTADHLIPTVTLWDYMSVEANFGDNPAKPFEYDIKKCPGMGLEWI